MAVGNPEATLRTLGGAMCLRCRHRTDDAVGARLQRCPTHPDTVLVSPHAVAEGDGDPFLGAVVAGRFAVLELLGAGSMGTVYRARQEAMGRDVALKVVRSDRLLDAQAKTRFQQEAHAMSLLASSHTVTVFDFGEIVAPRDAPPGLDGSLYLAMELLDGESIGDRIKRLGRLELADVTVVVRHTLTSLSEAHGKGVIHRDLKPDNLLLTTGQDGRPLCKVLDFGIAKLLTSDGRVDVLETQAGTVFGTPRYMSPEQAQGKKLDARSDLYALGVILYHMLVGRPPFADDDAVVVMAHHIKTVPRPPSEAAPGARISAGLEALVMRALQKDAALRPQSAQEFLDEFERAVAPSADTTVEAAIVPGGPAARFRRTLSLVALTGGLIAAALFGVVWLKGRPPAASSPRPTPVIGARPATGDRRVPPATSTASAAADSGTSAVTPSALAAPAEQDPAALASAAAASSSATKPPPLPQKKRGYTKFDH
jgi:serine/threonine-protein kinase